MAVLEKPTTLALESGDRLTRNEFEQRYTSRTDIKKAELIEGVVYVPSPVRFGKHAQPHAVFIGWLLTYAVSTPGVQLGDNATVRLDLDSEAQPDALLRLPENKGGASRISDDDYVEGPPEFIAEIAASSASYDLHDKLRVYRRNGVKEYLVWKIDERAVVWYHLQDTAYRQLVADEAGIVKSRVFPGLWLNVPALLAGDPAAVLATLQEGVRSDEHAAFAEGLAAG